MNIKFFELILESKFLKFVNFLFSLLALFFLFNLYVEIGVKINLENLKNMLYVFPILFLSNYMLARGTSRLSKITEHKLIMDSWFKSMLGKYIPFKVGIPIIRFGNIKQNLDSYSTKKIFKDLLFEQFTIILTSLLLGSLFFIKNTNIQISIMLLILIFSIYVSFKKELNKLFLLISNIMIAQIVFCFGIYIFTALSYSQFNFELVLGYILSASLSLFFIGAPAGIGVREYIGVSLLKNYFELNFILEYLLICRILLVFTDLLSYTFYFLYKKLISNNTI